MLSRRGFNGVTAAGAVLRPLVAVLEHKAVDPDRILTKAGLTRASLESQELRLPTPVVADLWREAVHVTKDPALGVRAALCMPPGGLGLVDYLMRHSASLRQGLDTLCRYSRLLTDGVHIAMETSDDLTRVIYSTDRPHPAPVVDFALAHVARFIHDVGQTPISLVEVTFIHPAPSDTRPYEEAFRSRVRFKAERNTISIKTSFLAARVKCADPRLFAILEHHAAKSLAERPTSDQFVDRVRLLILEQLKVRPPTAADLARELHMSTRTFQRRLLASKTTHSHVLDEVRYALAMRYLGHNELHVGEIAAVLGFSDSSAFRKAFQRWTGRPLRRP